MRRTFYSLLLASALLVPNTVSAASADAFVASGGFYPSSSSAIEGQVVRFYVKASLHSSEDVQGSVRLYSEGQPVGIAQPISIVGSKSDEVFVDWRAPYGGYFDLKAVVHLQSAVDSNPSDNVAYIKDFFVDYDTDGDGVGNNDDVDDDNDSLRDDEETAKGTNPLKIDTDDDGITDPNDEFPLNPNNDGSQSSGIDGNRSSNGDTNVDGAGEGSSSDSEGGDGSGSSGDEDGVVKADVISNPDEEKIEEKVSPAALNSGSGASSAVEIGDVKGIEIHKPTILMAPSDSVAMKLSRNGDLKIDASEFVKFLEHGDSYLLSFMPDMGQLEQFHSAQFNYQLKNDGLFSASLKAEDLQGNIVRTRISLPVHIFPLSTVLLLSSLLMLLILLAMMARAVISHSKEA